MCFWGSLLLESVWSSFDLTWVTCLINSDLYVFTWPGVVLSVLLRDFSVWSIGIVIRFRVGLMGLKASRVVGSRI